VVYVGGVFFLLCVWGGGGGGERVQIIPFFVAKRNMRYLPGTLIQRSQAHVW